MRPCKGRRLSWRPIPISQSKSKKSSATHRRTVPQAGRMESIPTCCEGRDCICRPGLRAWTRSSPTVPRFGRPLHRMTSRWRWREFLRDVIGCESRHHGATSHPRRWVRSTCFTSHSRSVLDRARRLKSRCGMMAVNWTVRSVPPASKTPLLVQVRGRERLCIACRCRRARDNSSLWWCRKMASSMPR